MSISLKRLGSRIDSAADKGDVSQLRQCIEEGSRLEASGRLTPNGYATLQYFLGNAWAGIDTLTSRQTADAWYYKRDEPINAIKCFRKAVYTAGVSDRVTKQVLSQAYTNLGNMFSSAGRIVYAIEAWKKALSILPNLGMAGCNFSHGLIYYAHNLYDEIHSGLLLRHAFRGLNLFLMCKDIHPEARKAFIADVDYLTKRLKPEFLKAKETFRKYSLGRSDVERRYRKWALTNRLFLNPLNDVFVDPMVAHDVLSLPNMIARAPSAPVFQGFFNELKQQYMSARYLFYHYLRELPEHPPHFSDNERHLVDTLDYPQYGLRLEHLKNSFKMAYSLFDKVGYFINEYLNLGIDRNRVNFRKLWCDKNGAVLGKIQSLKNLPLRGLYFLSKDFFDSDYEYLIVADPDAQHLADIRNHLEHKYFKIHWIEPQRGHDGDLRFDTLAFSVLETDFQSMALRILKCAREALIYLSSAVHSEERKRSVERRSAIPLVLPEYDFR